MAHNPHTGATKTSIHVGSGGGTLRGKSATSLEVHPGLRSSPSRPTSLWSRHPPQRSYIAADSGRAQKPRSFVH